jgi:hypothetical protein
VSIPGTNQPVTDYHNMRVGQTLIIESADMTKKRINSLRVIIWNWGRRNGQKFSVASRPGKLFVTRVQ